MNVKDVRMDLEGGNETVKEKYIEVFKDRDVFS